MSDLRGLRLYSQHLTNPNFEKVSEVVDYFGAMQAQDYAAAKWGVGLRMKKADDEQVEEAFNNGEIIRTHVMRPTWHFVSPEDIRWMLGLTAPRVKVLMGHYNKKLELDDKLFDKTQSEIVKAFGNKEFLTRQELKKIFENVGIKTDVQRLAHIVMWAELDGLICSGPRLGKQFSYALLEKRVKKAKEITRDEAISKLFLKYFTSHGPAQLRDFVWWSGLTSKDAQLGLDLNKFKLTSEKVGDKVYWFVGNGVGVKEEKTAFLLSVFDEYTIAYNDRSDLSFDGEMEKIISMGATFSAVVVINGWVVGTWKRDLGKTVKVRLNLFRELSNEEHLMVEEEVKKYGDFLGLPVTLE